MYHPKHVEQFPVINKLCNEISRIIRPERPGPTKLPVEEVAGISWGKSGRVLLWQIVRMVYKVKN
jgi:hypothetical protein